MQLLESIAAGIEDAADGFIEVKLRNSTVDAQVFSDPEGLVARAGVQHILGASGELECYVAVEVDVWVYDLTGSLLRGPMSVIEDAGAVVSSGPSFTGVDPISGATGTNKEITQEAINALWFASANKPDFKVQRDLVAPTSGFWLLKDLGITVGTAFRNPMSTEYGAKANGTTDDTTPLQNAINDLEAAGGGVLLLPSGTYRTTAALVIDSPGVYVWGFGTVIIQTTSLTANGFTITAKVSMKDLTVRVAEAAGANSTGTGIEISGAPDSLLENVSVASSPTTNYAFLVGLSPLAGSHRLRTMGGKFEGTSTAVFAQTCDDLSFYRSECSPSARGNVTLDDCTDVALTAVLISGNVALDDATGFTSVHVVGSRLDGDLTLDANTRIRESGNKQMGGTVTNNSTRTDNMWTSLVSRVRTAASAATLLLTAFTDDDFYDITGAVNITNATLTGYRAGQRLTLRFNGTLTLSNAGVFELAGNYNATDKDTIRLVYDGTSLVEECRSGDIT
jgi:hypothetical protein